ncbi:transforming growth factor beta activator LRRC33 [Bombina bombina]|uniref:transforming growth factor beta activator LRRC33 n=1 Tax=Bombina bombina TaxID=8345 RepID=UPI00235ABCE0|nr:transforming growth factor beta activator LRRC33 [Bombina bombina]
MKQYYRYADCSHMQLSSVPQDLPNDTEDLVLDFNHLVSLDEHSVFKYHDLKSLNLQSNGLKFVNPYAFQNTVHLESLSLQDNSIHTKYDLLSAALKFTPFLKKLDLSQNNLNEDMLILILRNLTSLESLYLDNNIIMRLDSSIFEGLSQLKELSLQRNYIYEIEGGTFEGLMKLRNLNLAYNHLPCIVDFGLTQLQSLNLSFNNIEWFQAQEIDVEFHLERLDISHNQLLFFPLLPRRNQLHLLLLSDNEMRFYAKLSDANSSLVSFLVIENNSINITTVNLWDEVILSNFSTLHYLDMSRNQFHNLPEGFLAKMSSLAYLKLNWNCLETFSLTQKDIPSDIIELDLSNNKLSTLQVDNTSQSYLGLKYFNLSNNILQKLPRHIFHNMNGLNSLDLSYNKINLCSYSHSVADIGESNCVDIRNLSSLRYLHLSGCGIELDTGRAFHGTAITYLDLSYNHLRDIYFLLDIATTLQFLYLRNSLPYNVSVDFSAFGNLIYLDISENVLTTFPTSLLELALHFLDLRKNSLTSLPLDSSYQQLLQNIKTIYLSDNPFDCCELSWWVILSKITQIRVPDIQEVNCQFSHSYMPVNDIPESVVQSCRWKTGGNLLYLLLVFPMCLTLLIALILLFLLFRQTFLQSLKRCYRTSSY